MDNNEKSYEQLKNQFLNRIECEAESKCTVEETRFEEIEYYYCYGINVVDPKTAREDIKFLVDKIQTMHGYIRSIKHLLENEVNVRCYDLAKKAEEVYKSE